MKLSLIIPMLNEAQNLALLLDNLSPLQQHGCDIIFVDGGSHDDSASIAARAGFTVIHSLPGRAQQMNAGAARATGTALLFLHADTLLPPDAVALVTHALSHHLYAWGRFDVRIRSHCFLLRIVAWMINWRSRLTGIATGDQAIFLTRIAFNAAGGFPVQPLMEDVEICKRLRVLAPPICLTDCVITSGRRWETRGVWRTIFLMWWLRWQYWCGVSPQQLAQRYR